MNTKIRYGLSAAVLALIGAGASAPQILDQFLDEKEGNHTMAYRDGWRSGQRGRAHSSAEKRRVVPDCSKAF